MTGHGCDWVGVCCALGADEQYHGGRVAKEGDAGEALL